MFVQAQTKHANLSLPKRLMRSVLRGIPENIHPPPPPIFWYMPYYYIKYPIILCDFIFVRPEMVLQVIYSIGFRSSATRNGASVLLLISSTVTPSAISMSVRP